MDGIGDAEPGMPINAGAGVPAAVGLQRVVDAHSYMVGFARRR